MNQTFCTIIAFSILGIAFAQAAEPQIRREQAIASLIKHGIKVKRDETQPGRPVTGIFFGCHRCTRPLVRELKHIPEVQVMNLRVNDEVTVKDLECLRSLVNLNELRIHHSPFNDESLAHLKPLRKLRNLRITSAPITDAGLKHLADLKELEELRVWGKGITDRGMPYLEKLTNLKSLTLSRTSVTNERLQQLRAALPDTTITVY